jgi:tRNA(Ile)-lysidine synthase TilS/MesJ
VPSKIPGARICSMQLNKNDRYLGISVGTNPIAEDIIIKELYIYKKSSDKQYTLSKQIPFEFRDTCPKFVFSNTNDQELIFITFDTLFKYNFETHESRTFYEIENAFDNMPKSVVFNDE